MGTICVFKTKLVKDQLSLAPTYDNGYFLHVLRGGIANQTIILRVEGGGGFLEDPTFNRPCVAGAVLQTPLSLIN